VQPVLEAPKSAMVLLDNFRSSIFILQEFPYSCKVYQSVESLETEYRILLLCLPVKKEISNSDVEYKILPAGRVISTTHVGPYDEVGRAYQRLIDYRNEHSLTKNDYSREIYIKGPGMLFRGNPWKYITEVQMPIEG